MKTEKNKRAFTPPQSIGAGFTLAELLTAIAVIAILIGILIPALNMARNFAKETKQKVQISSIDVGINMYKNDFGEYPPSNIDLNHQYCGSQKLAEALVGYDLLGVHKDTIYNVDGTNSTVTPSDLYELSGLSEDEVKANLARRRGPYVKFDTPSTFTLNDIFSPMNGFSSVSTSLDKDRYMICDTFGFAKVAYGNKTISAGTPILYFRADTSNVLHRYGEPDNSIYNNMDNMDLININDGKFRTNIDVHEFYNSGGQSAKFYEFIKDPIKSTTSRDWPVRQDSFILISAGLDGRYGTEDDICNFEQNIQ